MPSLEDFFPERPDSSRIMIGTSAADYSASRLARAVEDADAALLNLNITALHVEPWQVTVALRVSHRDPAAVCRSLERYGYHVISAESPLETPDDEISLRYHELMKYLSI